MRRISGGRWLTLVVVAGILLSGLMVSARTSPPAIAAGPGLSISGSVTGGGNMTIRVTLARTNLTAITVRLNSSRPSIVPVPATMTIPRGARTTSIQVRTVAINVDRTVNITGSWLSERQTKSILVKAPRLSEIILPNLVLSDGYISARVRINAPAPTGGLAIAMSSSFTYGMTHATSVTIPAGSTQVSLPILINPMSSAAYSASASLTAARSGRTLTYSFTIYNGSLYYTPTVIGTQINGSTTPVGTSTAPSGSVTPAGTPTPIGTQFNGSTTPVGTSTAPSGSVTPTGTPTPIGTQFNGSTTPVGTSTAPSGSATPTGTPTPTVMNSNTPSATATAISTNTPRPPTATPTVTTTATPSIASVSIDCPTYIFAGQSATCQAGLSFWVYGNLPPQTVQLSTANGYVFFPSAQVVLPPPAFIATFTITGGSSAGLETITASVDTVSTQVAVQVANNAATIDCPTYSFTVGNEVQCGLILSEPAPVDLVFTRYQASSDVNIPDAIVIPAGSTAFYFIAQATNDSAGPYDVYYAGNGYRTGTVQFSSDPEPTPGT